MTLDLIINRKVEFISKKVSIIIEFSFILICKSWFKQTKFDVIVNYKHSYKDDNYLKLILKWTWILHISIIAFDYLVFGPKYIVQLEQTWQIYKLYKDQI